jgi:hypothetical protein
VPRAMLTDLYTSYLHTHIKCVRNGEVLAGLFVCPHVVSQIVSSEFSTAVTVKVAVLWGVTPCDLSDR